MALMAVPPWIQAPDVVGAASAGGRLGLGVAQLGQEAAQAANKNALGYAQLGAEQATAAAQLQARQHENSLLLGLKSAAEAEQARKDKAAEDLRSQYLKQQQAKQTAAEELKNKVEDHIQGFYTGLAKLPKGKSPASLLADNPLASHDPGVQRFITDWSMTGRTELQAALHSVATASAAYRKAVADGDDTAAEAALAQLKEAQADLQAAKGGADPQPVPAGWQPTRSGDWLMPDPATFPAGNELPAAPAQAPAQDDPLQLFK